MIEQRQSNSLTGWDVRMLIVAVAAVAGCAAAWLLSPPHFFKAWLAAAMLPWSVSLGSLTLMLIFCLTGGRWGRAVWPWLAMNARLMPLVAVLFVPWLFGIQRIYPWANSDILAQFENTEHRQWLYHLPFYIGRTGFYFAVWSALACMVAGCPGVRRVIVGTEQARPRMILGGPAVAGLGLIAILLTVTWAGIDWVMSFDPFFASTLFGAMVGIGAMLAGASATVAAVCFWWPLHGASQDDKTIGDLSNLLLTFLMLWAYFSFAHFLIMWSGDLPIDASFYSVRNAGVWKWVTPVVSISGFVVPFLCLFSHNFKHSPRKVGTLALCLLAVRLVELWWMVLPSSSGQWFSGLHWATLPATVAVVAVYLSALAWMMRRAEHVKPQEATR